MRYFKVPADVQVIQDAEGPAAPKLTFQAFVLDLLIDHMPTDTLDGVRLAMAVADKASARLTDVVELREAEHEAMCNALHQVKVVSRVKVALLPFYEAILDASASPLVSFDPLHEPGSD